MAKRAVTDNKVKKKSSAVSSYSKNVAPQNDKRSSLFVLAGSMLLLLGFIVYSIVSNNPNSPKSVADAFMKAVENCDTSTATKYFESYDFYPLAKNCEKNTIRFTFVGEKNLSAEELKAMEGEDYDKVIAYTYSTTFVKENRKSNDAFVYLGHEKKSGEWKVAVLWPTSSFL